MAVAEPGRAGSALPASGGAPSLVRAGRPGAGTSRLTRSPGRRTVAGPAGRSLPLRSTGTGVQPGGQATSPSRCPSAGELAAMVISVTR